MSANTHPNRLICSNALAEKLSCRKAGHKKVFGNEILFPESTAVLSFTKMIADLLSKTEGIRFPVLRNF